MIALLRGGGWPAGSRMGGRGATPLLAVLLLLLLLLALVLFTISTSAITISTSTISTSTISTIRTISTSIEYY